MLEEPKEELHEGVATSRKDEKDLQELSEPDSQPKLESYHNYFEGDRIILEKFVIPLFFELDKERGRTHRWM